MTQQDTHHPLDFDEYIRQGEPNKKEKASIWQTAIGLQAVDGLQTSDYLKQTARKHIEGEIDIDEARQLIKSYYQSKTQREPDDDEKQEADKVSANITKILSSQSLDFTTGGFISIHRRVFEGVFKHAGRLRDYDIEQERQFSYRGISPDAMIGHISKFVSGLWQIHPFCEGNTRTTAVFTILYLRSIGFEVNNDMFALHSWYFRNALVRANYKNARLGIDYTPVYLERFFRNLILGDKWDLRNRYLHVSASEEWKNQPKLSDPTSTRQVPDKYPTSTRQVKDLLHTGDPNIMSLIMAIGDSQLSVKEMMSAAELKNRENFMDNYLNPAIENGYVRLLYPNSPRHPRQKYLLTVKGLTLYYDSLNSPEE